MNEQKCIWCHNDSGEELIPFKLPGSSSIGKVLVHPSHLENVRFYTHHVKKALVVYALSLLGIILGLFLGEKITIASFLVLSLAVCVYPVATPSSTSFFGMKRTHHIVRIIMAISVFVVMANYGRDLF